MELVALNLMKNALEASDAAGGAGEVVVTLFEEDERAIITVADDGGGTRVTVPVREVSGEPSPLDDDSLATGDNAVRDNRDEKAS